MKYSSRDIAIVGLLAALQIIALVAGYFIDAISLASNVLCSFLLMLTLVRGMYRPTLLGYVAVSLVTAFIMNLSALPYAIFTGAFTIFTCYANEKRMNKVLACAIKIVWANVAFYLIYSVFSVIVLDFSELGIVLPYPVIAVIVSLAVIGYDYFLIALLGYTRQISDRLFGRRED